MQAEEWETEIVLKLIQVMSFLLFSCNKRSDLQHVNPKIKHFVTSRNFVSSLLLLDFAQVNIPLFSLLVRIFREVGQSH